MSSAELHITGHMQWERSSALRLLIYHAIHLLYASCIKVEMNESVSNIENGQKSVYCLKKHFKMNNYCDYKMYQSLIPAGKV